MRHRPVRAAKAACAAFLVCIAGCARWHAPDALYPAWKAAADFPPPAGLGAIAAPRANGELIGIGGQDGYFRLLSVNDGRERARAWMGAPIEAGAAAVPGGFVVAADDGTIAFVDLHGQVQWRRATLSSRLGRPAALPDGSTLWISADGRVERIGPDGKRRWIWASARAVSVALRSAPPPLVDGDRVYCGLPTGEVVALSLDDGRLLWRTLVADNAGVVRLDELKALLGGFVLVNAQDKAYLVVPIASEGLVWLDAATGDLVRRSPPAARADLVDRHGTIFAAGEDGALYALDAHGRVLWRKALARTQLVGLVPAREGLWAVSEDGELFAVAETGKLRARGSLGRFVHAPVVPDARGGVLILARNGTLIAISAH